jgi:hypothetical protein
MLAMSNEAGGVCVYASVWHYSAIDRPYFMRSEMQVSAHHLLYLKCLYASVMPTLGHAGRPGPWPRDTPQTLQAAHTLLCL